MKQKIRNILLALTIALTSSLVLVPAIASADYKDDACGGINALNGTAGTDCPKGAAANIEGTLSKIVRILSILVGFAAVIMLIVGGLKYITANGDSGAAASARSTIIYAVIGLIIAALAQVLVHFVLNNI